MLSEVLSPREYQIVEELAKGYSEAYVAKKLGLTYNTVTTALARVYYKLRIPNNKRILSPVSVLIALHRRENPHHPLWNNELDIEDTRKHPTNCSNMRVPEYGAAT